jgi:hypothetical protein
MNEQLNGEKLKEEFLNLCKNNIKRNGVDNLLKWLSGSDFFTAPASSRFHLSCKYGLVKHSLNVYHRLMKEYVNEYGEITNDGIIETLTICALFHDLCKVNYYSESTRNVKNNATGEWEKVPYYIVDEKVPLGHGEKSVIIIQQFMKLKMEEILAINSHMGFSDTRVLGGDYSIVNSWDKHQLGLLLHIADLKASKIDEAK